MARRLILDTGVLIAPEHVATALVHGDLLGYVQRSGVSRGLTT